MLTLDHIVASSRRLDEACAAWELLGFTITPRGFHPFGTMNNLVMFERTFFEFLAFNDEAAFDAAVRTAVIPANLAALTRTALETREGPSLLAVTTEDADHDLRTVGLRGIEVSAPMHFRRPVVLPNGQATAAEVTVHFLEDGGAHGVPVFVSQQHNREAVWVREWQDHPNGAIEIVAVTCTAPKPDELVPYLVAIFGEPTSVLDSEEYRFSAGPSQVVVTTPSRCHERFPAPAGGFVSAPTVEALTVAVRDIRRLGDRLEQDGVTHSWTEASSIHVARDVAAGVLLEFVEATGERSA